MIDKLMEEKNSLYIKLLVIKVYDLMHIKLMVLVIIE